MSPRTKLVGDPHIGRQFKNHVPLHRRGERERMQRAALRAALQPEPGVGRVLCMGDLFDKPQVSYEDLWLTAGIVGNAAANHPKVEFWFLQGNHDESRDLQEITAWKLFELLMVHRKNVRCICDPVAFDGEAFFPWSPRYSSDEMIDMVDLNGVHTVYGHWDLDPRSASWNLIPLDKLAKAGVKTVYTGHIHLPSVYKEKGVEINVVGSLQPYAHGEDGGQGDVRYVTHCINGFEDALIDDPEVFRSTCVRIILDEGEEVPDPIDCLQWQVERRSEDEEASFAVELTMEGFSMDKAYTETMDEAAEILPAVREKIDARWKQTFSENS